MYIIATQRHRNTVQFRIKCRDSVMLPRARGNVGHHWLRADGPEPQAPVLLTSRCSDSGRLGL